MEIIIEQKFITYNNLLNYIDELNSTKSDYIYIIPSRTNLFIRDLPTEVYKVGVWLDNGSSFSERRDINEKNTKLLRVLYFKYDIKEYISSEEIRETIFFKPFYSQNKIKLKEISFNKNIISFIDIRYKKYNIFIDKITQSSSNKENISLFIGKLENKFEMNYTISSNIQNNGRKKIENYMMNNENTIYKINNAISSDFTPVIL